MPISYSLLAGYGGGIFYPQSSYVNNAYGFGNLLGVQYLFADETNLLLVEAGIPIII